MAKEFGGHYRQWEGDMYAVDCLCGKKRKDSYGTEYPCHVVVEPGEERACKYCGRRYWVEGYQRGKIMTEE